MPKLDDLLDVLIHSICEEEDRRMMSRIDDIFCEDAVLYASIRLGGSSRVRIMRNCGKMTLPEWMFILEDRRTKEVFERKAAATLFDGVEYFMGRLGQDDATRLWNWYLIHGDAEKRIDKKG